ncbi:alpha-xenorhabdolysin family binary toxin subunit A, partial [Providencia heimbachae]
IKTTNIKSVISDFRVHIVGGYLSDFNHIESLLFNVKGIYQQLDSINNEDSETYLKTQIEYKKQEIHQLEQEYSHFIKLCFTGLAGGVIGLIVTSSIFGAKAEKIRKLKNIALQEIENINEKINQDKLIKKTVFDIQLNLHKIEGFFKDARLAVDHLDYMWLVILTEINQSIDTFKRINDAEKLIRFITQFKRIVTSWRSIQDYSAHLISLFDELNSNDSLSQ